MAEKVPVAPESNQETKNTPPASADEFVSGIRKERQRLEDEITSTQDRDTSHNLEGYSELYERQKRRDLHDLEGKLLDLDQIWYDAGGAEVDALEAELKDPRNRGNKDALTDRLDRAKEAAYQNYLEETGQAQPEDDATGAKKEQEGVPANTSVKLGSAAAGAAGVQSPVGRRGEAPPVVQTGGPLAIEAPKPSGNTPETQARPTAPAETATESKEKPAGADETKVAGIDLKAEIDKIKSLSSAGERMRADLKLRKYIEENEGKTPEEVAALMDEARNAARKTVPAAEGAEKATSAPAADETAPDSPEGLPTDEELADHEEMEKQLREAGALKQPSARSVRRSIRKMRKKKAYQESYDMGFKTAGERMKKEKELFAKYRNEYFTAKGVKNSLLNRLRYRRGRDVK